MLLKKIGSTLFAALLIASSTSISVLAESPSEPETSEQYAITESYEYPFVPGTPEWVALDDRKEACQIPEDVLSQMTTDALIETCLNYPFAADIYAFNSVSQGITVVSSYFNGLQELRSRPDGVEKLLALYQETPVVNSKSREPSEEKFDSATKQTFLEGILSDDSFFHQLSEEEAVQFEEEVAQKYEERQENASQYLSLSPYYEKAAADQGIELYYPTTTIQTPKGSSVTVSKRDEMTIEIIGDINREYDALYPLARRQLPASNKYNCHNFAWNNQNKSYWMDNPFLYMNDGSYKRYGNVSVDGCIMYWVYVDNFNKEYKDTASEPGMTHSGISKDGKMLSKWGLAGVYLSEINSNDGSPYNSYKNPVYYMRQS